MTTSYKIISNLKLKHAAKKVFLVDGIQLMGVPITDQLESTCLSPLRNISPARIDLITDLLVGFIIEKNHTTTTNDGEEKSVILQPMTTSKRIIPLLSQHWEEHHLLTRVTNPLLSSSEDIKKQGPLSMFTNSQRRKRR